MALADTLNAIQWWNSSTNPWTQSTASATAVTDFAAGEQNQIISYITSLYASGTAASTIEQARGNLITIRIGKSVHPDFPAFVERGATGQPYLGFNNTEVAKIWYFNVNGTLVAEVPMLALIHEFSHTVGKTDPTGASGFPTEAEENSANWDFEGSALRLQNQVAGDLGYLSNIQASYGAALGGPDTRRSSFTLGMNYTENEQVKIVRIGTADVNKLDMSNRTDDSRDLLFGLGGDDILKGGGGRDFLYGGAGLDKLWGGEGNDVLVGEDGDDEFWGEAGSDTIWGGAKGSDQGSADGIDTVNYSGVGAGITITFTGDGVLNTLAVVDGEGDLDTLHSIEIIEGSAHADRLNIHALTPASAAIFSYINLGGGSDTIDIGLLEGSVTVDLRDPQNQTVAFGGAVLKLKNAEHVVGNPAGDIFYPPATAPSTVTAGAGDDTVYLAGSGHTIDGGGGYDVLNLSAVVAGSRIDMASGTALLRGSGTSGFGGFEEVVGTQLSDVMYGDGSGTKLVSGGGDSTGLKMAA